MGRPPTKPKDLRDGWYFEVRNKGSKSGIKIRRDTEYEMNKAVAQYSKTKDVAALGESKGGKWVAEVEAKARAKAKAKAEKAAAKAAKAAVAKAAKAEKAAAAKAAKK